MNNEHIYPGAHSLNTFLNIKGCQEAISFYRDAFGAKEKFRLLMPNGDIAHCEIEIEGSILMMAEENLEWGTKSPSTLGGTPVTMSVYVKDVDRVFAQAIQAGATELMAVRDEFYGDRVGQVMDPFGYKWSIATHQRDVSPEEMQKALNNMSDQG